MKNEDFLNLYQYCTRFESVYVFFSVALLCITFGKKDSYLFGFFDEISFVADFLARM